MPKLTRYLQKIFANNSNEVGVFGTGVDKETSKNVETLQSADYENGWSSAIITNKNYPIWQEMDGVQYGLSYQLKYLFQNGIPEWISTETYYTNQFCAFGGYIYQSLQDDNINHNPALDDGYWIVYSNVSNDRLHALKSYKDNGELLTDAEGLADVKEYAHSTFDSSKFTKVGSPIVTSDGIITNSDNTTNYIYIPNTVMSQVASANNWKVSWAGTVPTESWVMGDRKANGTTNFDLFYIGRTTNTSNNFGVTLRFPNNTYNSLNTTVASSYNGEPYQGEVEFTGTQYKFKITLNDGTVLQPTVLDSTTKIDFLNTGYFHVGEQTTGSIDLKQFSITVNGVPVFSGNKTGIDTIKPDDYTVVGTPTISADGIITNTDQDNNYIYIPETYISQLSTANTWKVKWSGVLPSSGHFLAHVFSNGAGTRSDVFIATRNTNNINNFSCIFYVNNDGTKEDLILNATLSSLYNGKKYTQNIEFTGTQYIWTYQFEGESVVVKSVDSTYKLYNYNYNDRMHIGLFSDGSIDLNAFKIYVDGDLVYQPCLKIPYTLSKTGSKIVDSVYRDRVNDMAEQFGFANYYTLSDTDFTLPQSELYGLLTRASDGSQCMPSKRYIDLTLGVSVSTYTAPANGYLILNKIATAANQEIRLINKSNELRGYAASYQNPQGLSAMVPCHKGDVVEVYYTTGGSTEQFRFIYAVGSESEAI